jgi:hypothetical protein
MTVGEVRNAVGSELAARLSALEIPDIGLYYDTIPSGHERLVVRFWLPVYGTNGRGYDGKTVERPTLQIDVKHYPTSGSTVTPAPSTAEILWEAVKLEKGVMKLYLRPKN